MATWRRSIIGVVLLGFVAAGCGGPSGTSGEYGDAWFSTDLIGGSGSWPPVALGSAFRISIETDAECIGEGDDDDSAESAPYVEPFSVTSSEPGVLAIEGVEQEIIENSDWAEACEVHIHASARTIGLGSSAIQLWDAEGTEVDRLELSVGMPARIALTYMDWVIEQPVAVMKGQTAALEATLYSEEGGALAHDGFETNEEPGDGDIVADADGLGIFVSSAGEGPLHLVDVSFGAVREGLLVRPVTRAGYLQTLVRQHSEENRTVTVYLAFASREGELILAPKYKVYKLGGQVVDHTFCETKIRVVLENEATDLRLRIVTAGISRTVIVQDEAVGEGNWWTAVDRVLNQAEHEEPAGCATAPGRGGAVLAVLLPLLLLFARRRSVRW